MREYRSIMLVDDDSISNFITETRLRTIRKDFRFREFPNGQKLLEFYSSEWENEDEFFPALLILDINMPIMDGFEFLEKFQLLPNSDRTEVVMLSSSTREVDKDLSKQFPQVIGYLEKPFQVDALIQILS